MANESNSLEKRGRIIQALEQHSRSRMSLATATQAFLSSAPSTLQRSQDGYYVKGIVLPDWDSGGPHEAAPFEMKPEDWGWLDGRPVALDYSRQAAVSDLRARRAAQDRHPR
jgi:hypothetical protein